MKILFSPRSKNCLLVAVAVLLLIFYYTVHPKILTGKHQFYAEMTTAAQKMQHLQQAVRQEMLRRGIEIDKTVDLLDSGLIGLEWSGITTTLGQLESKRTTVNPDFAALLVKLFKEAGLQKGDYIAANCSSSFPALNLAFIAAADTLELRTIMVTSVGASMYGGNREDFTYLDMEQYLYEQHLIQNKTVAYSLGGAGDIGKDFEPEVIGRIQERLDSYGLRFFYEADFEKNLAKRYAFYTDAALLTVTQNDASQNDGAQNAAVRNNVPPHDAGWKPQAYLGTTVSPHQIKAFINIGGNLLSLGEYNDIIDTEKVRLPDSTPITTGLVGMFLQAGTPVFYLLNIKRITLYYQLPFDPITLPEIGTTPIYYHSRQHIKQYVILGIFLAALYGIVGCRTLFFNKTNK